MGLVVERKDDARGSDHAGARVSQDRRRGVGWPLRDRDRGRVVAIGQLEGAGRQPRPRRRLAARGAGLGPRRDPQHEHAGRLRRLGRGGGELLPRRPAARRSSSTRSRRAPASTSFRDEILDEVPDFVFIEILEQGSTFEMSGTNGASMARIGRDVVSSSLPAALMFELSRGSESRGSIA